MRLLLLLLFWTALPIQAVTQSPWLLSANAIINLDDNVLNGKYRQDKLSELISTVNVAASYQFKQTSLSVLNLNGRASVESYEKSKSLGSHSLSVETKYHWQDSYGFLAPFYSAHLNLTATQHNQSQRDNTSVSVGLNRTQRLTHIVTLNLGGEVTVSDAKLGVFSRQSSTLYADLDYDINSKLTFYGNFSFQHGDVISAYVTSACTKSYYGYGQQQESFQVDYNYEGQWFDSGLSEEHCGNWYSYKLSDVQTHIITTGVNYFWTDKWIIDLSYLYADSNKDANGYEKQQVSIRLLGYF